MKKVELMKKTLASVELLRQGPEDLVGGVANELGGIAEYAVGLGGYVSDPVILKLIIGWKFIESSMTPVPAPLVKFCDFVRNSASAEISILIIRSCLGYPTLLNINESLERLLLFISLGKIVCAWVRSVAAENCFLANWATLFINCVESCRFHFRSIALFPETSIEIREKLKMVCDQIEAPTDRGIGLDRWVDENAPFEPVIFGSINKIVLDKLGPKSNVLTDLLAKPPQSESIAVSHSSEKSRRCSIQ